MRSITLADRSQAPSLDVAAIREEHRVLHHQHRPTATGHAQSGRFRVRLEDPRCARLRVVEQPIRRLRARPIAARLIDRRGRRFGQLFRGFQQATVQTFVAQISAGKLLRYPLDRLCAGVHDSLDLRHPRSASTFPRSPPVLAASRDDRNTTQGKRLCPALSARPQKSHGKSFEMCVIESIYPLKHPLWRRPCAGIFRQFSVEQIQSLRRLKLGRRRCANGLNAHGLRERTPPISLASIDIYCHESYYTPIQIPPAAWCTR